MQLSKDVKTMDLISVIVPVYKVEAYLDRCVQSIVDQTYQIFEIILVDDGSPDNCGAMCDAWAEKDNRIRVIHQKNAGSAKARNAGLDIANGQYIGFVDSDDYIHPEMYQYLYRILHETESCIAECGYYPTEGNVFPSEEIADEIRTFNTEEALRENIRDQICRQLLWNKLYIRGAIGDLRMVEGKVIDDEFFTYRVLAQANKIVVGGRKMYAYRQQDNSIMHQRYSLKRLGSVEARLERYLFLQKCFPDLLLEAGINLQFTCLYHGQLALKHLEEPEKRQAIEELKNVIKRIPLITKGLPLPHKCWVMFTRVSFEACCKLRNKLGIGL